jgi:hypothetical protein
VGVSRNRIVQLVSQKHFGGADGTADDDPLRKKPR